MQPRWHHQASRETPGDVSPGGGIGQPAGGWGKGGQPHTRGQHRDSKPDATSAGHGKLSRGEKKLWVNGVTCAKPTTAKT